MLIFGNHNLQNLNAAKVVCNELGISDIDFYNKISTFKGASNRLELVRKTNVSAIYKDFAHSPSKLKADFLSNEKTISRKKISGLYGTTYL